MLALREVLADEARRNRDGRVGDGALELGDGSLLLRLDGRARLGDHVGRLGLGLGRDVGLGGFAGLLGVGHDLGRLGLGIGQLHPVLLEHPLALDAGLFGLLEGILDHRLALGQHGLELGPAELREDDPQQDEDDEHGDELRHVGQDGADAACLLLTGERERGKSKRHAGAGNCGDPHASRCFFRSVFHVVTSFSLLAANMSE